jgi:hypothetical protein
MITKDVCKKCCCKGASTEEFEDCWEAKYVVCYNKDNSFKPYTLTEVNSKYSRVPEFCPYLLEHMMILDNTKS